MTKTMEIKVASAAVRKVMILNLPMNQKPTANLMTMILNFQSPVNPTARNKMRMKVMKALTGTRWSNKLMKTIRKLLSGDNREVMPSQQMEEVPPDQAMLEEDEK